MMRDSALEHRKAAHHHEMAAESHERAARFWADNGDCERAALQREMADYERQGAALEHRWADLIDPDGSASKVRAAELVIKDARQGAKQLAAILTQTAAALERTAELAESHADQWVRTGRGDDAAEERDAATRAREAARRARSQAEEWLKASKIPAH